MTTLDLTPHASTRHWSAGYCGLPWAPGADGPDAFDCWGLAREVQLTRHGRELPRLAIASPCDVPEQWATLRGLVQRSGWRRVSDTPREGDLLLMLNGEGLPHIGNVVELPRVCVLHALGGVDVQGWPHGRVQIDPVDGLGALGFGHLQLWRHG